MPKWGEIGRTVWVWAIVAVLRSAIAKCLRRRRIPSEVDATAVLFPIAVAGRIGMRLRFRFGFVRRRNGGHTGTLRRRGTGVVGWLGHILGHRLVKREEG